MTDKCPTCIYWLRCKATEYADGTKIVNWSLVGTDNGACQILKIETPSAFGCVRHVYDEEPTKQVEMTYKNGSPWMHWVMGPCPDCSGRGSHEGGGGCHRCAGTSKVRYYDDGYIGEEQHRIHPKEKEFGKIEPLKCDKCQSAIDVKWVACPYCGHRLVNAQAETTFVGMGNAGMVGGEERRAEIKRDKVEDLRKQIDEQNERLGAL